MNHRVQFINHVVIPYTNIYWVPILIKTLLWVLGIYQWINRNPRAPRAYILIKVGRNLNTGAQAYCGKDGSMSTKTCICLSWERNNISLLFKVLRNRGTSTWRLPESPSYYLGERHLSTRKTCLVVICGPRHYTGFFFFF